MNNRIFSCARGFLGTIISRYSNYDGYWIYGFLIKQHESIEINLLDSIDNYPGRNPLKYFTRISINKFHTQVIKNQINEKDIQEAKLTVRNTNITSWGFVNRERSIGFDVVVEIVIVKSNGRKIVEKKNIFVAPHNPSKELRNVVHFPIESWFPNWIGV
jgi:hypothetical protein